MYWFVLARGVFSTEMNLTGKFWLLVESLLTLQHCSFLLLASHSYFTKTSCSMLLSFTFLWHRSSSIAAKICNKWKLHLAFKHLPCLARNCHPKAEMTEDTSGCISSNLSFWSEILTNSTLPSQFKPRSWALPGKISILPFSVNSATEVTPLSRGPTATDTWSGDPFFSARRAIAQVKF